MVTSPMGFKARVGSASGATLADLYVSWHEAGPVPVDRGEVTRICNSCSQNICDQVPLPTELESGPAADISALVGTIVTT